jgi:carbon-monoxide dehydrogenase medium subunit
VKPPAFAYRRVERPEEAVAALERYGDEAKILAGGQSLVPMLALRLVRPSVLIDVSRLSMLRGMWRDGEGLRIGALTRHRDLERLAGDAAGVGYRALSRVVRLIGHEPIRTRGTFGGSVAHADPAAEWPLVSALLDAEMVALGPRGQRTIPVADFFIGYFTTALAADELLVEVRFARPWSGVAVHEHVRRHGDFALVSAGAAIELDGAGTCTAARLVLGAVDDVPLRAKAAEQVLVGSRLEADVSAEAADAAAAAVDPPDDIHASGKHRRRLAAVLLRRAIDDARERALEPQPA